MANTIHRSWYSRLAMVTRLEVGRGFSPGKSKTPFSSSQLSHRLRAVFNGTISLGVKRLGREADGSSPSKVEVKKMWRYISTPRHVFMA
jgi:hypothetical protein